MPLIDRLLVEAGVEREQIEAVAVSAGPGSFTGLRIGVATARALGQGLNIPVVTVCTLSALAEAVPGPGVLICPLLDARRSQVYSALFKRSNAYPHRLEPVSEPAALPLAELIEKIKSGPGAAAEQAEGATPLPVVFTGEGLHSYGEELKKALPGRAVITTAPFRLCRAGLVALRGQVLLSEKPAPSYLEARPRYLRRPEAERMAAEKEGGGKP